MLTKHKYRKAMEKEMSVKREPTWDERFLDFASNVLIVGFVILSILLVGLLIYSVVDLIFYHGDLLNIQIGHTRIRIK